MLRENQVVELDGKTHRVLRIREGRAALYPMNDGSLKRLFTVDVEALEQAEKSGRLKEAADPYLNLSSRNLTGRAKAIGDANYAEISDLVMKPEFFVGDLHERAALVESTSGGNPARKRKLYRLINTYCLKGQSPSSLIPEYGKGAAKMVFTKKPGRRAANGAQGVVLTTEIQAMFSAACRNYLFSEKKLSVPDAYRMMLVAYAKAYPGQPAPTLRQFRYYYDTHFNQAEKSVGRNGDIAWRKDKRPLSGTAKQVTLGIGDCYEIDSTLADQSLVSEFDRTLVIGRPTLWSVTDRASGLIVGVHVSMDPPSLQGAFDALYNAFLPKAEYCARHGCPISADEWPVEGVPRSLVFDNAELLSEKADVLTSTFGITLHNTASYRGDSKGTVESSLGRLQHLMRPVLPLTENAVRLKKAGGGDSRLNAALTLKEYTGVLINMVLLHNRHLLETTPADYPTNEAPSSIACWRWLLTNGKTCLRGVPCTPDQLRTALLVRRKASISADGICCEGLRYKLQRGVELGWFDRGAGVQRPKNLQLAIDPDDVSIAWLYEDGVTSPFDAEKCELAAQCAAYAGKPLFEAMALKRARSAARSQAEDDYAAEASKRMEAAQEIVRKAQRAAIKSNDSAASRLRAIAENKTAERLLQSQANPRVKKSAAQAAGGSPAPAEPPALSLEAFLNMDN